MMGVNMSLVDRGQQAVIGKTRRILGINFFNGSKNEAAEQAMQGGLLVFPAAPGLAIDFVESQAYRDALAAADVVMVDSAALVLFWRILSGERLNRCNGLMFLRVFLPRQAVKEQGALFWVMPSDEESRRNLAWLEAQGFRSSPEDVYIAPLYGAGAITDAALLRQIESRRPRVVMIAIGGGVQERLGHYLKQHLSTRPGIVCIGAAIAFLSGGQAKIPEWADAHMLAWLVRILYSPRRYTKRYWRAFALFPLLWRNRERMPPLRV
jgi:exopolysaccharide biosynthesis WecB/TagA/CpsF family protein